MKSSSPVAPSPADALTAVPAIPQWAPRLVHVFVQLKHILCFVFFATQAFVFLTIKAPMVRKVRAYNPTVMAACYAVVACLHLAFLVVGCGCCRSRANARAHPRPATGKLVAPPPSDVATSSFSSMISLPNVGCCAQWAPSIRRPSDDAILVFFNTFELFCQSYQLVSIMDSVVDRWFIIAYATVVILHCLVTPWLFLLRRHSSLHVLLVSWSSGFFNVCLSCLLPLVALGIPVFQYRFSSAPLANDRLFGTRVVLLARTVVASSAVDFATKLVMDMGTIISLRRLVRILASVQAPPASTRTDGAPPSAAWLASLRRRPFAVFLLLSLSWGAILIILCARVWLAHVPCPSTCVAYATPLVDLGCRCKYVHVNCHALGNESLDVDAMLDPRDVGSTLFLLRVSRCDLPQGLSHATLAPQLDMDTIHLEFTNMTSWDTTFPPSIENLRIRYSRLSTLPTILRANVPRGILAVTIEASAIGDLPDVREAWAPLQQLLLTNVSLTRVPDALPSWRQLTYVGLSSNPLAATPSLTWQTQVQAMMPTLGTVELMDCGLTDGPWALATPTRVLYLNDNPIVTVPATVTTSQLTSRAVVLDDTTFCNASHASFCRHTRCAPSCLASSIGNFICNLACLNAVCEFDGGDCDDIGLTPVLNPT
ncbi:Aste57867_14243 [Aphanomyces stellatus]|uniref:Aste57867_14243 protein n=1 Tax=Aphanomyces stellatus TaxID=120398 RepID=A0A485L179_9STRA|nr:hypothetical protein As57867_014192 [Aphanomyces stellatus]VFT91068.1 Aste57867_14243 [Aphanomyces stellatus]